MLKTARKLIFPDQCLSCGELVQGDSGLCGPCWGRTPFILGPTCDLCGVPLMGSDPGRSVLCDECHQMARPWTKGRSVMVYQGEARRLILGLKHGDRQELAPAMGRWMAARAEPLMQPNMLVVPVPLHWKRLLKRKYNQAALLSHHLARASGLKTCPDLLTRCVHTRPQDDIGVDARFANLSGAIAVHPKRCERVEGRSVLLVDDVMTSGATLTACANVCLSAGASEVHVMTLARVSLEA
nr:ComF family protein [Qingshengfaniella alkalisoli]